MFTELIQEYNRVYANGLKYISNNIDIDAFNVLISEEPDIAALLGEVIVGNEDVDIAKLIDQLQMSTWVESGMPYMEQSGDVCPFCQQPFTDKNALKHKLEQFFDKTYKEKMDGLREKAKVYYTGVQSQLAVLDDIVKVFNPDNKVSSVIGEMTAIRDSFVQAINEKKNKPNEKKRRKQNEHQTNSRRFSCNGHGVCTCWLRQQDRCTGQHPNNSSAGRRRLYSGEKE